MTVFHKHSWHVSAVSFQCWLSISNHAFLTMIPQHTTNNKRKHGVLRPPTTNALGHSLTSSNPNTNLPPGHHIPFSHSPRLHQKKPTLPTTPPNQLPHSLPLPLSLLRNQHLHRPPRLPLQASREQEKSRPHAHAPPCTYQKSAPVNLH